MHLPAIDLPSTKGARLSITARSFSNISRQAEDAATVLRAEAQAGTQHPRTVADFYAKAVADLAAIRAATEAEIGMIEHALAILDGNASLASQHPLALTAAEMKFTKDAIRKTTCSLARDKAVSLVEESRNQLKGCREAARRALDEHLHREDVIRRKAADALRASIVTYTGPYRISLKDAAALLGLDGIPDDPTPLPAPSYDPRLPADHPARMAAVLQTVCKSKEAEAELQRQHRAAKTAQLKPARTVADDVRDGLIALGGM